MKPINPYTPFPNLTRHLALVERGIEGDLICVDR
jgi:hypothetical protein